MAADRLHIPDLIHIAGDDPVRLIGAVGREQLADARDRLTRRPHIRQHERDDVLLAETAGHLFAIVRVTGFAMRRHELDERIGGEHARIHGDRLGCAHRHIVFVDARFGEHAAIWAHVRHNAVQARVAGQIDLHVADHTAVVPRLVFGPHRHEFLRIIGAAARVIVACDDRGAVVTR